MQLPGTLHMALSSPITPPGHATREVCAATRRALRTGLVVAMLVTLAATARASQPTDVTQLQFGVYGSSKPSAMVQALKPALDRIASRMSTTLGEPVRIRMKIASDREEGIRDLSTGQVDFSQLEPASYVQALRVDASLTLLAMERVDSSRVSYGVIAVHSDSDIHEAAQLENRSFAFGDRQSTVGRYLPQVYLEQSGVHADDLSNYGYLGRYDKVGTAVGAGDYDAGALDAATFNRLVKGGEPLRALTRLATTTNPWVASSALDPRISDALRDALLQLDDAQALTGLRIDGFTQGAADDFDTVRASMQDNQRFFTVSADTVSAAGGL